MYHNVLENPLFKAPDQRLKIMEMSIELYFNLLFNPIVINGKMTVHRVEGMPNDVQIQSTTYDPIDRMMLVRLWSSTFPVVQGGCAIPRLDIQIESRQYPDPEGDPLEWLYGPNGIKPKDLKAASIGFEPTPTLKDKMNAILEKPTRHIQFANNDGTLCDCLNYEATDPKSLKIDGYYSCLECADRMTVLSLKECDRLDEMEKQINQDRETAFKSGKNPFEKPDWRK